MSNADERAKQQQIDLVTDGNGLPLGFKSEVDKASKSLPDKDWGLLQPSSNGKQIMISFIFRLEVDQMIQNHSRRGRCLNTSSCSDNLCSL